MLLLGQPDSVERSIERLVHDFYKAVREDPTLGPVFARHIADDAWSKHLTRMCDFWSSILLGTRRYRGNPMEVHAALPDLHPEHFARWLNLFEGAAAAAFGPDLSGTVLSRAHRMARRLQAVSTTGSHARRDHGTRRTA